MPALTGQSDSTALGWSVGYIRVIESKGRTLGPVRSLGRTARTIKLLQTREWHGSLRAGG